MVREKCQKCNKEFGLTETNCQLGNRESENINCPYCGHITTRKTSGIFQTYKLEK
jgi:DNA-directed RNA polymerase subunit RPC12/RpoP